MTRTDDTMEKPTLMVNGKRLDGRDPGELREIKITAKPIHNAGGSAYIEWGANKILVGVYGPREALPRHTGNPDRATIKCRYSMAPFSSLEEHSRPGMSRRSIEISKVTAEVFEDVILLDQFPANEICIYVEVLQGDGGTRAAGITCASVALATSGIPMKDMPYSVSVGKIGETLVLDPNKIEDNYADADMPIAINPRTQEISLLQMDGLLTKEEFNAAIEMAKNAGKEIVKVQREALRKPYEEISEMYS